MSSSSITLISHFLLILDNFHNAYLTLNIKQGGHKPGKHGKPGKLREFEKLLKSQGKLREIFYFAEKPGKLRENVRYVTKLSMKFYCREFFSLVFLREKFENTLDILGKTQGI